MATPTVLDAEPLLVPIAGDNPSGRNLFYEPQYDELREARRVEPPAGVPRVHALPDEQVELAECRWREGGVAFGNNVRVVLWQ